MNDETKTYDHPDRDGPEGEADSRFQDFDQGGAGDSDSGDARF
jgi:hypothetical protein